MKQILFSFIFINFLMFSFHYIFSLTSEDFLNSEITKKRNTARGNIELIRTISNEIVHNPGSYDLYWESAALWYTEGQFFSSNIESKKYCFALSRDYALAAVRLNPYGPDGHYWLGVAYALWSEANGILDSLFYVGDIINEMTKVIDLKPDYFHGSAYAIRAKVYDLAPGWPISLGDKEKSELDIRMALMYGNDYRFVLMTYVEILLNDARYEEAKQTALKGLTIPYDRRVPLEEDFMIGKLKRYLKEADEWLEHNEMLSHPS